MIKLIVSDMDGTLLNDEKEIDSEIYTLLPKMKEKGIRFVVASGRQYPSLKRDFQEHIKDVVVIAENGAFVMDHETELLVERMTGEEIAHCLDAVQSILGAEPLVCAKYRGYTKSPELFKVLSSGRFGYDMGLCEDLYDINDDIIKVSVIDHSGRSAEECYEELRGRLDDSLNLVISGPTCLDTGIRGVNKGTAVAALQKMWQITPEETMVFGDQYNDVEMFDCAYYSYAMEGAAEGVKKRARFLAGSNNESGVVRSIRQITGL